MSFLSKLLMLLRITANGITKMSSSEPEESNPNINNGTGTGPGPGSDYNDKKMSVSELDMVMNKLGLPGCEELQPMNGWVGPEELWGLFEDDEPSLEELKETFGVFDENKDGFIDARELQRVLIRLGLQETSRDLGCERMIRGFDEDGDGFVDFREFVKLMEKCFL